MISPPGMQFIISYMSSWTKESNIKVLLMTLWVDITENRHVWKPNKILKSINIYFNCLIDWLIKFNSSRMELPLRANLFRKANNHMPAAAVWLQGLFLAEVAKTFKWELQSRENEIMGCCQCLLGLCAANQKSVSPTWKMPGLPDYQPVPCLDLILNVLFFVFCFCSCTVCVSHQV